MFIGVVTTGLTQADIVCVTYILFPTTFVYDIPTKTVRALEQYICVFFLLNRRTSRDMWEVVGWTDYVFTVTILFFQLVKCDWNSYRLSMSLSVRWHSILLYHDLFYWCFCCVTQHIHVPLLVGCYANIAITAMWVGLYSISLPGTLWRGGCAPRPMVEYKFCMKLFHHQRKEQNIPTIKVFPLMTLYTHKLHKVNILCIVYILYMALCFLFYFHGNRRLF